MTAPLGLDPPEEKRHHEEIVRAMPERRYEPTEMGLMRRLVDRHGSDLMFVADAGRWRHWDGTRWAEDVTGEVHRRVKQEVDGLLEEIKTEPKDARRTALVKHFQQAQTARVQRGVIALAETEIDIVWTAIALHTTPGIPQHMHPVIALVTAGVEMDVLGLAYPEYSDVEREGIVDAHPRTEHFKEDIIQAFYDGIKDKPNTTFGNVKADVIAKEPHFRRGNFCSVIRGSAWRG